MDAPLDLNELLVNNPPATYFVRALNSEGSPFRRLHFEIDTLSFSAEITSADHELEATRILSRSGAERLSSKIKVCIDLPYHLSEFSLDSEKW